MKKSVFTLVCLVLLCFGTASASLSTEKTYTNSIGVEFVLIPAGSFMMGTDPSIEKGYDDERPRHKVTLSKPFYLGKYEVTQVQWEAVMGSNPSYFTGRNNPAEMIFWNDAQEFIRRLNLKEGHNRYRLPTEAEWEYAVRAGTTSEYFFGDDMKELPKYAWCDNAWETTLPVGTKPANAWGLHDVHGNVREWVQDWYDDAYYASSPETDPKGPEDGLFRMIRGGGFDDYAGGDDRYAGYYRSGFRYSFTPDSRYPSYGFRLALSLE